MTCHQVMFALIVLSVVSQIALASTTQLFRTPGLRKVAKNWVKSKIDDDLMSIARDRPTIFQLLKKISLPLDDADSNHNGDISFNDEIERIHTNFRGKNNIDEHEFSSFFLSNPFWQKAGERAVKEFIYLDSLQHAFLSDPIISIEALSALEESLIEDGSNVPGLKGSDAVAVCAVAATLVGTQSIGMKNCPTALENEALFAQGVKVCRELRDEFSTGMWRKIMLVVCLLCVPAAMCVVRF